MSTFINIVEKLRNMSENDAYIDVVELCALLQCMGFSVKSLNTCDSNLSQDGGTRTVEIYCQSSGLHVVLESPGLSCSCPASATHQNSGVWQVSGVSGGKQLDREFGCTLLGSLPKVHKERLQTELREIIKCIKQPNESVDGEEHKMKEVNKSASMIEVGTPEKSLLPPKVDTPTRYRSLDTLTGKGAEDQPIPAPGPLTKCLRADAYSAGGNKEKTMFRQSTYMMSPTAGSIRRRNKTSSPIQNQENPLLENLIDAEKVAEHLKNKLSFVIRNYLEQERDDSSMSSLALDVSKISVAKGEPAKPQFASSPNLSGLGTVREDFVKNRLKRIDSASTSNLDKKQTAVEKPSRLQRISPSFFKAKKDLSEKPKIPDTKGSKSSSLYRPKIGTPVTRPMESSPSLSGSKRKFSHVKSTIPRPTPLKKE